jgi:glycerol-3-phosphate dehydrogenase
VLVNATGPWLGRFAADVLQNDSAAHLRLVKGSHIVVRRLFDHDHGYIFQNSDRRVVFALPFEQDFTLIGTTDEPFAGDPQGVTASAGEIDYLCAAANSYLRPQITPADVIWSFAGIRSLYEDGSRKAQDTSRDYVLALDERPGLAPLLSVYGGKITTYRRLAEQALERLAPRWKAGPAWTAKSHLPGGAFAWDDLEGMIAKTRATWPFLAAVQARRLVRSYGTRVNRVLDDARRSGDLGLSFGAHLSEAEVRYLMREEWARTADDVLWRRSKLGLRMTAEERRQLAQFMAGVETP